MSLSNIQILNSGQATYNEIATFPPFNDLPKELRTEIWRYALQRQRLIHVQVRLKTLYSVFEVIERTDCTANESSEEALTFHRVHLPCKVFEPSMTWDFYNPSTNWDLSVQGTLHFNPESDILQISAQSHAKETMVPFLHRLKTIHDPHHAGLLNVAMGDLGLRNCLSGLRVPDLDSKMMPAFVEPILQLREVWFVSRREVKHRKNVFNGSIPILTTLSTFERFLCDPPSIREELENVPYMACAKSSLERWLYALQEFHIAPRRIKYSLLVAYDPHIEGGYVPAGDSYISDRVSARSWLQKFETRWNRGELDDDEFRSLAAQWPYAAQDENSMNEITKETVKPAFGFWLFPLDGFAQIDREGHLVDDMGRFWVATEDDYLEDYLDHPKELMFGDMTKHWPEIGLSILR